MRGGGWGVMGWGVGGDGFSTTTQGLGLRVVTGLKLGRESPRSQVVTCLPRQSVGGSESIRTRVRTRSPLLKTTALRGELTLGGPFEDSGVVRLSLDEVWGGRLRVLYPRSRRHVCVSLFLISDLRLSV